MVSYVIGHLSIVVLLLLLMLSSAGGQSLYHGMPHHRPYCGLRIGQAAHPGPTLLDDPEADLEFDEPSSHHDIASWDASSHDAWLTPPEEPLGADIGPLSDEGFSEEQLKVWRRAERDFGVEAKCNTRRRGGHLRDSYEISGSPGDYFRAAPGFCGSLHGYVFTTRQEGTGYYLDNARLQRPRRVICLQDLISSDMAFMPTSAGIVAVTAPVRHLSRRKPVRHARRADGKRLRRSRRRPAQSSYGESLMLQAEPHSELRTSDWKAQGLWAIDTSNPNSWTSAERAILPASAADALLLQETKLLGQAGLGKAKSRGDHFGWRCLASMAHRTAADKASGGCAVAVRRALG